MKKSTVSVLISFLSVSLILTMQNCSEVQFEELTYLRRFCENVTLCDAETFSFTHKQPEEISKKLDLLFVVDSSSSLDDEIKYIANGISQFVSQDFTDLRIGVMLAHGGTEHVGRLYNHSSSEPLILTTGTGENEFDISNPDTGHLELLRFKDALNDRLTHLAGDIRSYDWRGRANYYDSSGEVPLFSLQKGLTEHLEENQQEGFFRDDASLAVFFVTDENDICSANLMPKNPDGSIYFLQNEEQNFYNNGCLVNGENPYTYDKVYNLLKNLKGSMPLVVSGLFYIDPASKPVTENKYNDIAYGVIDIVALSHNIDVDYDDYDPNIISQLAIEIAPIGDETDNEVSERIAHRMGDLGELVYNKIVLQNSFDLKIKKGFELVPKSVVVTVDGLVTPSTSQFDPHSSRATVFVEAGQQGAAGSHIVINYVVQEMAHPAF